MKKLLITIAFVGLALATLYPIRGMFPPFYYQEFNAVQKRLGNIDGLRIHDSWQHKDIVLEDCGFDVSIDDRNASLTFTDHQDWVALFENIDGIRIPVDGHQRLVTCEQMKSAGIKIDSIAIIASLVTRNPFLKILTLNPITATGERAAVRAPI